MKDPSVAIDLEKFSQTPESAVILRLMWGLNEMNQLADLAHMVSLLQPAFPDREKYYEGLTTSLARQRSAIVGEVLDMVVRPLVADDAKIRFPELHKLITEDKALETLCARLRNLFYGKDKNEFELHRQIRHRITAHFDHKAAVEVLSKTLPMLVKNEKLLGVEKPVGWHFQCAEDHIKHVRRFLVVDDVLNLAWVETILGIEFDPQGHADSPELNRAIAFTRHFMQLFHEFSDQLIYNYLSANDLFSPSKQG